MHDTSPTADHGARAALLASAALDPDDELHQAHGPDRLLAAAGVFATLDLAQQQATAAAALARHQATAERLLAMDPQQ